MGDDFVAGPTSKHLFAMCARLMDVPTGLNYYRCAEAGLLDLVKQMLTYSINSPREGYRSSSRNVNRRVRCKYVQFYFQIISDRRTINVAPANALLIS